MTRKPGSSADVNWPLQDCLPEKSCCFTPADSGPSIQAGLKGSAWPSCLHFGLDINFPFQGWSVFYQSKSPPNTSFQATKKPVAQVLMKNSKLSLFLQTQNLVQPLSRVKPKGCCPHRQPGKLLQGPEHWSLSQLYPCPCCAVGSREQKSHWYTGTLAPCSIYDHGFKTKSLPGTHRNQECPSRCSSSPPLQWLIAVLKPVYHHPWRLNWLCMGSAPPINILLFSQTCHLIFKRDKHCIVINLLFLPACFSTSACDLGHWVNLPQHCWRVVWPGEGSWAAQGEAKSPSAQQWRFIASPLETPVTVLLMTDC